MRVVGVEGTSSLWTLKQARRCHRTEVMYPWVYLLSGNLRKEDYTRSCVRLNLETGGEQQLPPALIGVCHPASCVVSDIYLFGGEVKEGNY